MRRTHEEINRVFAVAQRDCLEMLRWQPDLAEVTVTICVLEAFVHVSLRVAERSVMTFG